MRPDDRHHVNPVAVWRSMASFVKQAYAIYQCTCSWWTQNSTVKVAQKALKSCQGCQRGYTSDSAQNAAISSSTQTSRPGFARLEAVRSGSRVCDKNASMHRTGCTPFAGTGIAMVFDRDLTCARLRTHLTSKHCLFCELFRASARVPTRPSRNNPKRSYRRTPAFKPA